MTADGDEKYVNAFIKKFFPCICTTIFTHRKDLINGTVQVDDNVYNLGGNNCLPVLFNPVLKDPRFMTIGNWPELEIFLTEFAIELYRDELKNAETA